MRDHTTYPSTFLTYLYAQFITQGRGVSLPRRSGSRRDDTKSLAIKVQFLSNCTKHVQWLQGQMPDICHRRVLYEGRMQMEQLEGDDEKVQEQSWAKKRALCCVNLLHRTEGVGRRYSRNLGARVRLFRPALCSLHLLTEYCKYLSLRNSEIFKREEKAKENPRKGFLFRLN